MFCEIDLIFVHNFFSFIQIIDQIAYGEQNYIFVTVHV